MKLALGGNSHVQCLQKFGVMVLGIALTSACATTIKGKSDYNPAVNFADYHTFAWMGDNPLISAPPGMNPINVQRIMDEIERNLIAKGYRRIHDQADADFVVSFTIGARDKINVDSYPAAYGGYWGWGGRYYGGAGMMATDIETYTEGVLAIDIFDVDTHQPAWHGWATKVITASVSENPGPVIAEAVSRPFSRISHRRQAAKPPSCPDTRGGPEKDCCVLPLSLEWKRNSFLTWLCQTNWIVSF